MNEARRSGDTTKRHHEHRQVVKCLHYSNFDNTAAPRHAIWFPNYLIKLPCRLWFTRHLLQSFIVLATQSTLARCLSFTVYTDSLSWRHGLHGLIVLAIQSTDSLSWLHGLIVWTSQSILTHCTYCLVYIAWMSWLHRFTRAHCLGYTAWTDSLSWLHSLNGRIVLAIQSTDSLSWLHSLHRFFAIQSTLIRCLGDTVNTGSCLRYTVYTNLPPWLYSQHRPTSWLNSQHKLVSWLRGNLTIRCISSAIPTLQFLPRPLKSLMSRVILSGHWSPYNMVTFHIGQ